MIGHILIDIDDLILKGPDGNSLTYNGCIVATIQPASPHFNMPAKLQCCPLSLIRSESIEKL